MQKEWALLSNDEKLERLHDLTSKMTVELLRIKMTVDELRYNGQAAVGDVELQVSMLRKAVEQMECKDAA
jgi:hypothetical protein